MPDTTTVDAELREWASGLLTLEAATEMLIRAGYAGAGRPWVIHDADRGRHWIDFESIDERTGGMSGGERRFLLLAAAIADAGTVQLGDVVAGLDYEHTALVLAAIAHVASVDVPTRSVQRGDQGVQLVDRPPLYAWPTAESEPTVVHLVWEPSADPRDSAVLRGIYSTAELATRAATPMQHVDEETVITE